MNEHLKANIDRYMDSVALGKTIYLTRVGELTDDERYAVKNECERLLASRLPYRHHLHRNLTFFLEACGG